MILSCAYHSLVEDLPAQLFGQCHRSHLPWAIAQDIHRTSAIRISISTGLSTGLRNRCHESLYNDRPTTKPIDRLRPISGMKAVNPMHNMCTCVQVVASCCLA
eukprot:533840-Amphidinium_carterae.1